MVVTNKYLLLAHEFYVQKIETLKKKIKQLKETLPQEKYLEHEDVKLAARLRKATFEIIPEDPNRIEYKLKGELKKFRRYKQGLQRYRLIFAFSNTPSIIIYLYINDDETLRKDGSKTDPYQVFAKKVRQGYFSHDPNDPKMKNWVTKFSG